MYRLLQNLRYKNERITDREAVFINDNGRKVNKNNNMMKVLGKVIGYKDWQSLTPHGNRKKGVTDAAKASSGALHNKMTRDHCRHSCEDSQKPYLKPGAKERAEFFDCLEGKEVEKPAKVVKSPGGVGMFGFLSSIHGFFFPCRENKNNNREVLVEQSNLMNENHKLLSFIKSEGLLEKFLTKEGSDSGGSR